MRRSPRIWCARWARRGAAALAGLWLLSQAQGALGAGPPGRIVSLNPCLDAILLDVADAHQIAALSAYSRDPAQSAVAGRARRFAFTDGSAEAVAVLRPDLVLISGPQSMALRVVLPRLGIAHAEFAVPETIVQSLAQVRRVAALVGHPDRGEAVVARIQAALKASEPATGEPRMSALIYEYHGMASGPHTLVSELMARAGLDNAAGLYGLTRTGEVPLERLLADPPQVLLSGALAPGEPSWGDRVLSHPALRAIAPRMRRENFPETLLFCAGPVLIPAAVALAQARRDTGRGRR